MSNLFRSPKLRIRTEMIGSVVNDNFLIMFPEFKDMIDSFDPRSPSTQESVMKDFAYFAHSFDGSEFLKVKVDPSEKSPFVKYEFLDEESKEFGQKLANVVAIVNGVRNGENDSFFPSIKHYTENHSEPEWIKNTMNNFYMMTITFLIDSELPHI